MSENGHSEPIERLYTDEEVEDILGPGDSVRHQGTRAHLTLVGDDSLLLPGPDELAYDQVEASVTRLFEDTRSYARFPWDTLHQITGKLCPGDLWVIAGRTGHGKSLFLLNFFNALVDGGWPVLYVGLEQAPAILRIKWACLRSGITPKLVLAPDDSYYGTDAHLHTRALIAAQLEWQKDIAVRELAHFASTRFVDRTRLIQWITWAVDVGCQLVIVDHVDRMSHGTGVNPFHELSESIRLAKELAVKHNIVVVLASQVGRPKGDPLQRFMRPALHELRGAGTKEEEADAVLTAYRPLRRGITAKELTEVRQGLTDNEANVYEPDTMAVCELKHRLDGAVPGRQTLLRVERGRLLDRPLFYNGQYDV